MLSKLTIKNYALIDELSIDFAEGLNIVTGETGAGKSIILGALSLILGGRADSSVLRDEQKKCVAEGTFDIENYNLESFFTENDIDYEPVSVLRREITPNGKSRAFINDTPVNARLLSDLSSKLIDIHSQHQNLELSSRVFQLSLVDIEAKNQATLSDYKVAFFEFQKKKTELEVITAQSLKEKADLDYYEFQFKQLEEANLAENEQEELEAELEKLTHAEEIKSGLVKAGQLFDNDQLSALQMLKEANGHLKKIAGFMKEASSLQARTESLYIELKDISEETQTLAESVEYNPLQQEKVSQRLGLIYSLQQKHHLATVGELIKLKELLAGRISGIVSYDRQIAVLEKEIHALETSLWESAANISKKRQEVFKTIEEKIVAVLKQLGMPNARFKISHEFLGQLTGNGTDLIGFLFSANKDSEPDEISKIASGGEISRLMLAIKSLITDTRSLPTIIFDEIDAGVSGEIAIKMGNILKGFSKSTQIINITHLPQIAGQGEHHYKVFKTEDDKGTFTSIRKLSRDERVMELAQMVGGNNPTESAVKTAMELLSGANKN